MPERKIFKLAPDIFNIAVWSNRSEGAKKVGYFKRFIFTIISAIVILAQVQISTTIIKTFLLGIKQSEDHTSGGGSVTKLAPWNAELFVSTIACFFITCIQIYAESKDRIVVMTVSSNPIFWLLAFVSYTASVLVSVAVFLTIYQQTTVNDLWFNYAGLLVIIQIDDLLGQWACTYMLDSEIQEAETFLKFDASETELFFAQKLVMTLMAFYVIWTISLYRIYKIVGEEELSKAVAKYKAATEKLAGATKEKTLNGFSKGLNGLNSAWNGIEDNSSLNLASLDYSQGQEVLFSTGSGSALSQQLGGESVNLDMMLPALGTNSTVKAYSADSAKKLVTADAAKTQKVVENIVLYTCPLIVVVMFLWPFLLLIFRCLRGLFSCCCSSCFKESDEPEQERFRRLSIKHEEVHLTMQEKANAQKGVIAELEEQVMQLVERAKAIQAKKEVSIN